MTLKEQSGYYYKNGKSCAEALLTAANDVYGTNFSDAEILTFTGFGGGMGCKSTCGSLTGAIAILSRMYGKRAEIRDICAEYVKIFTEGMGIDSIECGALEEKYRTVEARCQVTVEMTAEMLEKYIDKLEGRSNKAPAGEGCTLSPEDIKRVKG
ncbi:MAG: C-GCAxxG-C-C family protein, partial [Clostridia bacterium]|nr:C-GCAxxG-C-C family protein [Clostridia bacterium]